MRSLRAYTTSRCRRDRAGGGAVVERELSRAFARLIGSQATTFAARSSTFAKSSNIDLGKTLNFFGSSFERTSLPQRQSSSISFGSIRAKRISACLLPYPIRKRRTYRAYRMRARSCQAVRRSSLRCPHKRCEERRADRDAFHKVIENGGKSVGFRFVLCERPRHRFVNVLIAALEEREDFEMASATRS